MIHQIRLYKVNLLYEKKITQCVEGTIEEDSEGLIRSMIQRGEVDALSLFGDDTSELRIYI